MNKGKQNSFLLEANSISPAFVYLQITHQKIPLCYPGTWIDQSLFEKCAGLKDKIITESVIDEELKENFKSQLDQHLKFEFEQDWVQSKNKIIPEFNKMLESKKDFLNWSIACFQSLSALSASDVTELHEMDVKLFRKAQFSAAIAIWLSLVNGFYEPLYLKDIYHITFLQDAGLIHEDYSYFLTEALDQESLSPGLGIKYLIKHNASDKEIKLFKDHPFGSYEFIKKRDVLYNSDLANTVLLGHELSSGEGFPFGYTEAVLASWEKTMILADHLVKYNSTLDFNLYDAIENVSSSKLKLLPVKKVFLKAIASLPPQAALEEGA